MSRRGTVAQTWGRRTLALVTVVFLALATTSVVDLVAAPLENRFQPRFADRYSCAKIEGVIVLGGALSAEMTSARGWPELGAAADRVVAFIDLARHHPNARMVVTGGWGTLERPPVSEAQATSALFDRLGVPTDRVIFEGESRNTRENAALSAQALGGVPKGRWILVTSALHMPRAVGVFQALGWRVAPYPVDFRTRGEPKLRWRFDLTASLDLLGLAVKEWVGLGVYHARGWTPTWLPGPESDHNQPCGV